MLGVGNQYLFEDRMGFAFEIFGLGSFFLLKMCLFDPSVFVEFDFSLDFYFCTKKQMPCPKFGIVAMYIYLANIKLSKSVRNFSS